MDHRAQEVLPLVRFGFDHPAVFELQAHAVNLASAVNSGETEVDVPFDTVLNGTGKDLAVGKILLAIAVDPATTFAPVTDIGVFSDNANLACAVEEVRKRLLVLRDAFPGRDGILVIEMPGAVHEVLVLLQRHLRILRAGMTRPLRANPTRRFGGNAIQEEREQ